ncbi:hypothetical protein GQ42DRAFT_24525 [Ramicandelaber brevisporus]|nr:hypothetical protein GQ42DRAFT_24525 [Ramicandelaber brevisporus]
MNSTFGRLLRSSRYATHEPKLRQIFTTFGSEGARGDWGMKSLLPPAVKSRLLEVRQLDQHIGIPHIVNAQNRVLRLRRIRENFVAATPPSLPDASPPAQIADMTPEQWQKFLTKMRERRGEWKVHVKLATDGVSEGSPKRKIAGQDWLSFANVSNVPVVRVVGPWYDHHRPMMHELEVRGRVLSRLHKQTGYFVGVGGVVGNLQAQDTTRTGGGPMTRDVKTMYVKKVRYNSFGDPIVEVSLIPPKLTDIKTGHLLNRVVLGRESAPGAKTAFSAPAANIKSLFGSK